MKRIFGIILILLAAWTMVACNRGEGGAAGYGAGGGQSLREGSTSPLHSSIAQDETYQTVLGLNIILYPPPVDDPKFETYGAAYWDMDATAFVQAMRDAFTGQMGDQAVYEPAVEALQNHPFVQQVSESLYNGDPVQVGWIYGDNESLDYLEYNGVPVTLITAENALVFVGSKADIDETTWTYDVKNAKAFYVPANSVIAFSPDSLHSAPIRVADATGQLTAIIVPEGLGIGEATPGAGIDQALVAPGRWIFALPGVEGGYYEGLTGSNKSIVPID